MKYDESQWRTQVESSPGNALWWVEIASMLDNLKTAAVTDLYLGDIPIERRKQAAELDSRSITFMEKLRETRLLVGQWAGDEQGTKAVSEAVTTIWKEWCRQRRRVSDFLAEVHWRDLGVAG